MRMLIRAAPTLSLAGVGAAAIFAVSLAGVKLAYCLLHSCDFATARARPVPKDGFKGKVVWITGASSGIGKELAKQFAAKGARLILSSRRREALLAVRSDIVAASRGTVQDEDIKVVTLDLEHVDSMRDCTRAAIASFGKVNILVNNGGVSQRCLARESMLQLDKRITMTDFTSHIALARALLPHMHDQGAGNAQIINISSLAGKCGIGLRSGYCAAKAAVLGWMDALRAEEAALGTGVKILNVCPGSVSTQISNNALMGDGSKFGVTDPNIATGLPVEYCCERVLAAAYAELEESWIARPQELFPFYLYQYFPFWMRRTMLKNSRATIERTLGKKISMATLVLPTALPITQMSSRPASPNPTTQTPSTRPITPQTAERGGGKPTSLKLDS